MYTFRIIILFVIAGARFGVGTAWRWQRGIMVHHLPVSSVVGAAALQIGLDIVEDTIEGRVMVSQVVFLDGFVDPGFSDIAQLLDQIMSR